MQFRDSVYTQRLSFGTAVADTGFSSSVSVEVSFEESTGSEGGGLTQGEQKNNQLSLSLLQQYPDQTKS
jgi:hypothetical protein